MNKIIAETLLGLFFLVAIVTVIFNTSASATGGATWTPVQSCSKDDLSDLYTLGTLSSTLLDGTQRTDPDRCYNGKLIEYYCQNGNEVKRETITCPNGCLDGACVSVCGDGVIEGHEVCDGNTPGFTCSSTCDLMVKDPLPAESYYWQSKLITVQDEDGNVLPNAFVSIYERESTDIYPFEAHPNTNLLAKGKTDTNGQFLIKGEWLPYGVLNFYDIEIRKEWYLSKSIVNRNNNQFSVLDPGPYKLELLIDYPESISPEVEEQLYPVNVNIGSYSYFSPFEVAGREIIFPYVPHVREDLLVGVNSVDVKMHVVTAKFQYYSPQGMSPIQDFNFALDVVNVDVELDRLNTFRYTLPEGLYYRYFEFVLHKFAGIEETFYYFPYSIGLEVPLAEALMVANNYDPIDAADHTFISIQGVYQPFTYNNFAELISGHNDINEERINLVFLNVDFDPALFNNLANFMINDPALGFSSLEPFQDNLNLFNFWYYNAVLTPNETSWPFALSPVFYGQVDLTQSQKSYLSHNFKGKTIWYALINDENIPAEIPTVAGSGKCQFNKGVSFGINGPQIEDCLNSNTEEVCFAQFQLSRVFNHELGHELGWLGEEYNDHDLLFNVDDYALGNYQSPDTKRDYNLNYRPNTHFPVGFDVELFCRQTAFGFMGYPFSTGYSNDYIFCENPDLTFCSDASWADLVGDGCGADGVVDCTPVDPFYYREVGCYSGGGQGGSTDFPNIVRPTKFSLMSYGYHFSALDNSDQRVYGLANERSLCRAIKEYTGSVDGICTEICGDCS
ncbi:MAG TPA: carboxypeptidase-like regulatory domain-containing protein [Candidatus Nanoarchaeia archaeon]|nr:carboxypeptidase-like regulatory domain-containing protein [Candidatus Nanoarchaeia archaeon]